MHSRSLIILSVAFMCVLVASALVLMWPQWEANHRDEPVRLMAVCDAALTSITRTDVAGTSTLVRSNGGWALAGVSASGTADRAAAVVAACGMARFDIVSNHGRSDPAFGFLADKVTITLERGGESNEIDLGAPTSGGVYASPVGSDAVYLLRGEFGMLLRSDWRAWGTLRPEHAPIR